MKDTNNLRVQEGRDDFPIFIHSELDDYGLTCVEFRVYGRIARRANGGGRHLESAPHMAAEFGVSEATIRRALKLLVLCNLVSKEVRPGKSTVYRLLPKREWAPRETVDASRERVLYRETESKPPLSPQTGVVLSPEMGVVEGSRVTRDGGGVSPQTGVVLSPETDEGSPSEGTPPKVLPVTHTHESSGLRVRDGATGRVCVPDGVTMYSAEQWREYALAHPVSVKLPEQFVWSKRVREGQLDEAMREWYAQGKPVEGSAATAKPADTSACPDCEGRGYYFTNPTDPKTHARCTHPRLAEGLEALRRQYDEAQAELAGASRS